MTKSIVNVEILDQAASCFKSAQRSLLRGAKILYQIREDALWEGQHSSFSEYLEERCGMSEGQASKILKAYKHWVLDAGFTQEKLEGIDTEKLYLGIGLQGNVEDALEKVRLLTRKELKDQITEEVHGEHTHVYGDTRYAKCKICDRFHAV